MALIRINNNKAFDSGQVVLFERVGSGQDMRIVLTLSEGSQVEVTDPGEVSALVTWLLANSTPITAAAAPR